jgi:hypothetical protein
MEGKPDSQRRHEPPLLTEGGHIDPIDPAHSLS